MAGEDDEWQTESSEDPDDTVDKKIKNVKARRKKALNEVHVHVKRKTSSTHSSASPEAGEAIDDAQLGSSSKSAQKPNRARGGSSRSSQGSQQGRCKRAHTFSTNGQKEENVVSDDESSSMPELLESKAKKLDLPAELRRPEELGGFHDEANEMPPELQDIGSDDDDEVLGFDDADWEDEDEDDEEEDEDEDYMGMEMNESADETDGAEEEGGDILLKQLPKDAYELIAPLPVPAPRFSLAAMSVWNDLNTFQNYAAMKQKLYGHPDVVKRLDLFATLEHHTGCVNSLNFNPSGTLLISGSDDQKVGVWDWARKKTKFSFVSGHYSNVFQTKFMPLSGDSLIVTASRDGAVRLAELSEAGGAPKTKQLCRHNESCHKVDVRPDARHQILSCGEDALVHYIDIREPQARRLMKVRDGGGKVPLYSIMSNPLKGHEFIVNGHGKFVWVYDLRYIDVGSLKSPAVMKLCPPLLKNSKFPMTITSAVYNFSGSEILASYSDFNIFLFKTGYDEATASIPIQEYEGHRNNQTVKSVNFFGQRSEYVVSGSDCGRVFFWERESGRIVHYLYADGIGAVNVLEPHPTEPFFATSGLEHTVKVWAPTREDPLNLEELVPVLNKHSLDRRREIRSAGRGNLGGVFFMRLMDHLHRRGNNPARAPRPPANPGEMPALDDESDEPGFPGPVQCGTT